MSDVSALEQIRDDPDPLRRARRATELITEYQELARQLANIRRQAIEDAHDGGMAYKEIAAHLGLSKGRVSQIRSGND
ncbi:sigma factor-like helix-turn-helix DNA-binding protein [Nocardia sp. NPDC055002]